MLGLGNAITSTSVVGGGALPMSITTLSVDDTPDSESTVVGILYDATDPLGTLQGFSSASEGDQLGGTYSLKIERYTDLIANGGTVAATATATVFSYRWLGGPNNAAYISSQDSSNIAITNFQESGSALFNLKNFGGVDLTGGAADGVILLYVFTLTVSGDGFLDAVKATSEVSIPT